MAEIRELPSESSKLASRFDELTLSRSTVRPITTQPSVLRIAPAQRGMTSGGGATQFNQASVQVSSLSRPGPEPISQALEHVYSDPREPVAQTGRPDSYGFGIPKTRVVPRHTGILVQGASVKSSAVWGPHE